MHVHVCDNDVCAHVCVCVHVCVGGWCMGVCGWVRACMHTHEC